MTEAERKEAARVRVDAILSSIRGLHQGFRPLQPGEKWWNRQECWNGHCHMGFNFHQMGSTPYGRHVLNKEKQT